MPDPDLPPVTFTLPPPPIPVTLPPVPTEAAPDLPLVPQASESAGLPPIPSAPPSLPALPDAVHRAGSVGQALQALELETGISRTGFWAFAVACWVAAGLMCAGPINHVHALFLGPIPSLATHDRLMSRLDAIARLVPMNLPIHFTASSLGAWLVGILAATPVFMLAAVWSHRPLMLAANVRWLGLLPLGVAIVGATSMGLFVKGIIDQGNRTEDIFFLHQPLYYGVMAALGLAVALGACLAVASPLGNSFAAIFPARKNQFNGLISSLCVAVVVIGMVIAGDLSDGRPLLAKRIEWQKAELEANARELEARARQERDLERAVTEGEVAKEAARIVERQKQDEIDRKRLLTEAGEAKHLKTAKMAADANQEKIEATERAAAVESERLARIKRQNAEYAEHAKATEAERLKLAKEWAAAKTVLEAEHPATLILIDRALVDVDAHGDLAIKAGGAEALAAIRSRLTTDRTALITVQQARIDLIKTIFKEIEYRRLGEAQRAYTGYLSAGGDRAAIAMATRLESICPWATLCGKDETGAWADLDGGKVTVRLRLVTAVGVKPELWLGEKEFSALDAFALIRGQKPIIGDSTDFPVVGITFAQAKQACDALSLMTTLTIRLPTTVEWIAAQSGGTYVVVPPEAELAKVAWFGDTAGGKMHPSGTLEADRNGLFDMLGNASEWVVQPDGSSALIGGSQKSQIWDLADPQKPDAAVLPTAGFRFILEP